MMELSQPVTSIMLALSLWLSLHAPSEKKTYHKERYI